MLAGGANGSFYRFDGDHWSLEADSISEGGVLSIHGTGPQDIHAVGDNLIYHYDGTSWTDLTLPGAFTLYAVWALDESNAFAVGERGVVMRYNGSAWQFMVSGVTTRITDVWGSSPTDVYAVGDCGMIHFDGSRWTRQPVYRGEYLFRIVGRSADDIVAFGRHGSFWLRFDGHNWNPELSNFQVYDIMLAADGSIYQSGLDDRNNWTITRSLR